MGVLALGQAFITITPDPTPDSVLDEPPTSPRVAAMRYFDDGFRDRDDADEAQCDEFTGVAPDDLLDYKDEWQERTDTNGSASYIGAEPTDDGWRVEIEFRWSIDSSGEGLGFGEAQWGRNTHDFDITTEQVADEEYCISSVEYVDPTDESPISQVSHYLMYVSDGATDDAAAALCEGTNLRQEQEDIRDTYAEIDALEDDRAWNESGDTQRIESGLLIPWAITSEQTEDNFMELEFTISELDNGYCIDDIDIIAGDYFTDDNDE